MTQIFIRQGLSDAIVQRKDIRPDHLDTAFWTNVVLGVVAMAGCIALAPWLERVMRLEGLAWVLIGMSPSMLMVSLNAVQDGLLRRELNFKPLAIRRIAATIAGGSVGIGMAVAGYGVWSLVAQVVVGGVTGVIFLWFSTSWRPGWKVTRAAFKDLYSFSIHILASNVVALASKRADTFFIGRYLGAVALGLYDVASRVMWVLVMALTSITNRVSFSAFSRINDQPEKVRAAFYELTSGTAFVSFPCFAGVAIVSPWLVPVVFGEQWLPAVPIMQVLTWMGIPQSLAFFNSTILRAMGKPKYGLIILCLSAVWNVVGFLLVFRHGLTMVAWVFLAGSLVLLPLGIFWVRSLIGLSWRTYLLKLLPSALCTMVMVLALYAVAWRLQGPANGFQLIVLVLVGMLSYAFAAVIIEREKAAALLKHGKRIVAAKRGKDSRKKPESLD